METLVIIRDVNKIMLNKAYFPSYHLKSCRDDHNENFWNLDMFSVFIKSV